MERVGRPLLLCLVVGALAGCGTVKALFDSEQGKTSARAAEAATVTQSQPRGEPIARGADLFTSCETLDARLTCIGYLSGVVDALAFGAGLRENGICQTVELGPRVLREIFVEWARRNPSALTHPASLGVTEALRAQFPCG